MLDMHPHGESFEATGTLVRDGGGFALHCPGGAVLRLILPRMPVDHVEKTVRIVGTLAADGSVDVEGVGPARGE